MAQNYIGVDLSKDWLDIFDPARGAARIANTDAELRAFLGELGPQDMLIFEREAEDGSVRGTDPPPNSGCDGRLIRLASIAGQPFHRLNPLHGWHFARSLNLPKTDRVDARMLARLGAERRPEPASFHDAIRAELAELHGRRDQLKRMETQEKNRLHKASCGRVRADIRAMLRVLAGRIAKAEAAIEAYLAAHPALHEQAGLLQSIPGLGRVTAVTLLSAMPELGRCDRREATSLAGLAPRARESGKWTGQRFIGGGRRHVRRALYMAALSAIRHGSFCSSFVKGMRARGKAGKVIAIAVARKILTVANAVLRDKTPFNAQI